MKREITAQEGAEVAGPDPLKKQERQFAQAMEQMVDLISRIYKRQVLEGLDKDTVKKFEDGQFTDANFAREFLTIARRVTRNLKQRFSFDRLERIARTQLDDVSKQGRDQFYGRVSKVIGIDPKRLANEEGLQARTNALMLETAKWAEKLRDETLEMYTANSLRAMAEGRSLEDVISQFDGMKEKRKNHAQLVARTQVSTFNSLMTKARAENLGITKAVWVTSRDERVRPCHAVRDGKEFELAEGLYSSCDGKTLLPGTDYACRCTYRLIIPTGDE